MRRSSRVGIALLAVGLSIAGLAHGGDIKTYRFSVNAADADLVVATALQGPLFANGEGTGPSAISTPSVSGDGSLVAFDSEASNLVAPRAMDGTVLADTNGVADIFVHDVRTRLNRRVTVGPGGAQANGPSRNPAISADGSYVAFESDASNLVGGDTNGATDVFVAVLRTGAIRLVSRAYAGGAGNGPSRAPSIDENGNVAFESDADDLARDPAGAPQPDTNGATDVFVTIGKDDTRPLTFLVSQGLGGAPADGPSSTPSIDPRAGMVAFASRATNLVPGDTNGAQDIFLAREFFGGQVSLVSRGMFGPANGDSRAPSMGGWHSMIAFESDASDLDASDTNGKTDIFLTGEFGYGLSLVTRGQDAQSLDGASYAPALSKAGIAFLSTAFGEPGATFPGVFLATLDSTGGFESVSDGAMKADGASYAPAISADGLLIAYGSDATNLVADDTNGVRDLFGRVDERRCANGASENGIASDLLHRSEDFAGRASGTVHSVACLAAQYGL